MAKENLNDIWAFLAVAREKSFTNALIEQVDSPNIDQATELKECR